MGIKAAAYAGALVAEASFRQVRDEREPLFSEALRRHLSKRLRVPPTLLDPEPRG